MGAEPAAPRHAECPVPGSSVTPTYGALGSTRAIPALSSERLVGTKAVNRRITSECLQLGGEQASVARPVNGKDAPTTAVRSNGGSPGERTSRCPTHSAAVGGNLLFGDMRGGGPSPSCAASLPPVLTNRRLSNHTSHPFRKPSDPTNPENALGATDGRS